ncbi:MAG: GNAT family N-acetyltransferase [Ktedonobacteraceae bacterium]|nr:GNAT family N-acetyltransferase [Ktedonobacteraceae bacterium]MBO0789436.1 GNAT family N-acetyltransferase [Ktedonobacteraceae bacterium]
MKAAQDQEDGYMQIAVAPANEQEMRTIRHFFLDFFYALSQYDDNILINEAGLPIWKPHGLPGPQTVDEFVTSNWWIRDECLRYLIRVDGNPAGFAIVCAEKKYLPEGIDFELLDFYITPKYRQQGVGRQAAIQVLELHHGRWVVYELARNMTARRFWQAVLTEYTHGNYEDLAGGTEQRFTN